MSGGSCIPFGNAGITFQQPLSLKIYIQLLAWDIHFTGNNIIMRFIAGLIRFMTWYSWYPVSPLLSRRRVFDETRQTNNMHMKLCEYLHASSSICITVSSRASPILPLFLVSR